MLIRCPDCHLEREINPDSIPASAVMATCPRCKTRFRFRSGADGEAAAPQAPAEAMVQSQPSPDIAAENSAPVPTPVPVADPATDLQEAKPVRLGQSDDAAPRQEASEAQIESGRVVQADPQVDPEAPEDTAAGATPLRKKGSRAKVESEETTEAWLDVPWERPDRYGHIQGLYQTIVRVLFNAPRFFAALPRCRGSIMRPLLFYVALGLFQVLVKLMWFRSIDPSLTDPRVQELISSADMTLAMTFIVSPGILALQLFFYAALFFLMLRLVQPEVTSYPVVLRVVAYSSAPMIMCAVPVVGPMVSMVWFAALCFVGCRFALNMPWVKVAMALVPLYLIGFAITMQFVQRLMSM